MKLRNKKTGEIGKLYCDMNVSPAKYVVFEDIDIYWEYDSLTKLEREWEDYEEPETYYYISDCVNIESLTNDHCHNLSEEIWERGIKRREEIGNYFETREEAEKAVKKLKAWKRLKDKGFRFIGVRPIGKVIDFDMPRTYHCVAFDKNTATEDELDFYKDLMLLFGGEE